MVLLLITAPEALLEAVLATGTWASVKAACVLLSGIKGCHMLLISAARSTKPVLRLARHLLLLLLLALLLEATATVATNSSTSVALQAMERQTRVLVPFNQPIIHGLIRGALSLEAGQWHQLPLFDEEVASILACEANFLELFSHELSFQVTDAL